VLSPISTTVPANLTHRLQHTPSQCREAVLSPISTTVPANLTHRLQHTPSQCREAVLSPISTTVPANLHHGAPEPDRIAALLTLHAQYRTARHLLQSGACLVPYTCKAVYRTNRRAERAREVLRHSTVYPTKHRHHQQQHEQLVTTRAHRASILESARYTRR
jgi:hypothetical protein